jgi:hypothetical protein
MSSAAASSSAPSRRTLAASELQVVLSFLSSSDLLLDAARVSKDWRRAVDQPMTWRPMSDVHRLQTIPTVSDAEFASSDDLTRSGSPWLSAIRRRWQPIRVKFETADRDRTIVVAEEMAQAFGTISALSFHSSASLPPASLHVLLSSVFSSARFQASVKRIALGEEHIVHQGEETLKQVEKTFPKLSVLHFHPAHPPVPSLASPLSLPLALFQQPQSESSSFTALRKIVWWQAAQRLDRSAWQAMASLPNLFDLDVRFSGDGMKIDWSRSMWQADSFRALKIFTFQPPPTTPSGAVQWYQRAVFHMLIPMSGIRVLCETARPEMTENNWLLLNCLTSWSGQMLPQLQHVMMEALPEKSQLMGILRHMQMMLYNHSGTPGFCVHMLERVPVPGPGEGGASEVLKRGREPLADYYQEDLRCLRVRQHWANEAPVDENLLRRFDDEYVHRPNERYESMNKLVAMMRAFCPSPLPGAP